MITRATFLKSLFVLPLLLSHKKILGTLSSDSKNKMEKVERTIAHTHADGRISAYSLVELKENPTYTISGTPEFIAKVREMCQNKSI